MEVKQLNNNKSRFWNTSGDGFFMIRNKTTITHLSAFLAAFLYLTYIYTINTI